MDAKAEQVLTMKFTRALHSIIGESDLHAGFEHEGCVEREKSQLEVELYCMRENAPMVPSWILMGVSSVSVAFLNSSYETAMA